MTKNNQFDKIKSSFKKRNYKAFFFFIGFTLLIWLFVQMSKTYEHSIELSFELKDIPKHIVVEDSNQSLKARVTQTGFKILSLNLFNSELDIKFSQLDSLNQLYIYDLDENKSELLQTLNLNDTEIKFEDKMLTFKHFKLATKRLRIKPDFEVRFSKGYDSIGEFKFDPAHIEVSGKDSLLKNLEYISTENKVLKEVSDTIKGQVEIQKIDSISVNYATEVVDYVLPVSKFTEGSFEIPISFENRSLENKLIIFPKTVIVNFKTSLSNYESIDESGFKVIAKYKEDEDLMSLELTKQPKHVKNVSLDNNTVDFLIKE